MQMNHVVRYAKCFHILYISVSIKQIEDFLAEGS